MKPTSASPGARPRLDEARRELASALAHPCLVGKPLLV
jgi:hypothetical protein